jgi:phage repressor protein C with HTH and peptisase S24 domain
LGGRKGLVAVRLEKRDETNMKLLIRAGSMVAIDRGDREIDKNKPYAVRSEWGCAIKFLQKGGDILIMMPRNPAREAYPIQILNFSELNYDPIIGRVIWNWQTL